MSKIALVFKNPLLLVIPFVFGLLLLWQQYTLAERQLSAPQANILPNADLDELDSRGFPIGWQLSRADEKVTATPSKGYTSPASLVLTNTSSTANGNTTLTSPIAGVQSGETYLYKAFYRSDTPFDLLLRKNFTDSTSEQIVIGRYDPSTRWETAGYAFVTEQNLRSVQFIYSFSEKGKLEIDNTYLEPHPSDVSIDPAPATSENRLPNAQLTSVDATTLDGWSKYAQGDNESSITYESDPSGALLRTRIGNYKTGEAKWQHTPIGVKAGQLYGFTVTYRSDVAADVVAEYELASGERKFETIRQLLAAKDWTTYSGETEVPAGAINLVVAVVQRANGTVDTKGYGLFDRSKAGELMWDKPRLSFTFDDGWKSAYTTGASMLNLSGYEGSFYLNPSTIDTEKYMTSDEVAELVKSGHEIASHGHEHLDFTTLARSDINYQFEHAYNYFKKVHAIDKVNYAAPFGGSDAQTTFYAKKFYTSARGTTAGVNTKQNFNPYHLRVLYMGSSVTNEKLRNALDEVKSKNGWLILVYHRIEMPVKGDEMIISPAQFQEQIDTVKASQVSVGPVAAVLQEIDR